MRTISKKKCYIAVGLSLLPLVVAQVGFVFSNLSANLTKASQFNSTLDDTNSPVLTDGQGSIIDNKGVTWEYYNAEDNNSGHVSLDHQGYFGVSSSTTWGYTDIDSLTVNFTKGENGELWLLTSFDGVNWNEGEILTSGVESHAGDNWRYVRFYYWDEDNNSADITSVNIGFGCAGTTPSDDADLAKLENLRKHNDLDATEEYDIVSPRCGSTQAIRLTTTIGTSTSSTKHETIFNIPTTTVGKARSYKIEFDYYYLVKRDPKKQPGFPSLKMANNSGAAGILRSIDANIDAYTNEDIGNGWWHFECNVSYILQAAEHRLTGVISGITLYDDAIYEHERDGQTFVGYVVIDNLMLTNHERGGTTCNTWTSVKIGATDKDRYFIRESFCGSLQNVTYSCSDTSIATLYFEQKQGNDLCYIEGLTEGTIVVTMTYTLGYNRQTVIVHTKTLTVGY